MKKTLLIVVMVATLSCVVMGLSACEQKAVQKEKAPSTTSALHTFAADDEIITYQKVDPDKTQLVVARVGNIEVKQFCRAFEELYPNVQVIYLDITGGNQEYTPASEWVKRGYLPDVIITTANFFTDDEVMECFENFSSNPIIECYEAEALQRTAINSNIYWLPGPSSINAITYNKTLFAQYGWNVPKTFDEFVALCVQIREDTNGEVEAWNPNAKYSSELQIALEAFVYSQIFGGVENRTWYNDYIEGNATFAGHMEPYYETIQTLANNDILREEHFSYSATTRGKEFASGKIAMANKSIADEDNEDYDMGYMAFPGTQGELGYVCDTINSFLGIPVQERDEEKQRCVDSFLEYFSSVEGQLVFIGNALKVSNVKDVPFTQSGDLMALEPVINAGHMFEQLSFAGPKTNSSFSLHDQARAIVTGDMTVDSCIAAADEKPPVTKDATQSKPNDVIATAPEDMTVLETSFYIADMYREKTDADIGLIAHNAPYRGNMMRTFAGDLTSGFVTVLMPRSFGNDSKLIKVSMTGQQLLDVLDAPPSGGKEPEDAIYAFSGLKCEVAPWNALGEKYLSVKLADGSELDSEKLYTVAFWEGSVDDAFITEVLETYEGSWAELMTEKMQADKTVTAANDGRITLVWE